MVGQKRSHSSDGGSPPPPETARSEYKHELHVNQYTNTVKPVVDGDEDESGQLPMSQSSGEFQWMQPPGPEQIEQSEQSDQPMPPAPQIFLRPPSQTPQETSLRTQKPTSHPFSLSQQTASSPCATPPASSQVPTTPQEHRHAVSTLPPPSPGVHDQSNLSNATMQTVSDVAAEEKSQWRQHTDPEDFFNSTGWDRTYLETFRQTVSDNPKERGIVQWLPEEASEDLSGLQYRFRNVPSNEKEIRWDRIFNNYRLTEAARIDDMVYVWIQVKLVDFRLSRLKNEDIKNVLHQLLPMVRPDAVEHKIAANAFHAEEMPTADGQPSDGFCDQLLNSYAAYDRRSHLAPYISVVGPSGIGKSFMMRQMAVRYGIYVVYTSFAPYDAGVYPKRSLLATKFPTKNLTRPELVKFWDIFIVVSLIEVDGCRQVGITATGLYNLRAKDGYEKYQEMFSGLVLDIFNTRRGSRQSNQPSLKDEVLGSLESRTGGLHKPLRSWLDVLNSNGDNPSSTTPEAVAHREKPDTLICFDEARELTDDGGCIRFRSLREALDKRYGPQNTSSTLPGASFFAAFLDTNSRIMDFSPPAHVDKSLKMMDSEAGGKELLPPIYVIDTVDVFCDKIYAQKPQDGLYEAALKLFQLGRPLWGSRCSTASKDNISHVVDGLLRLAKAKTEGMSPVKRLASLSYRLQFYVMDNQVAEQMVQSCLRYVLYINPARDLMRTIHPSEPVLAYTSQVRMIDPKIRLKILQQFVTSCFEGSVDAGDIGEMVASLVLMFAYDEVLFKENNERVQKRLPSTLQLGDFMASLLGDEQQNIMAGQASTDSEMIQLWEGGLVFFNHFVRAKEDLTESMLEKAYERGAAIFLRENFPGVDLVIPIKGPDGGMTFLGVQVKNRKDDNERRGIQQEAASSMKAATDKLRWTKPHIGLMMCLRHNSSATKRVYLLKPEPKRAAGGPSTRKGKGKDTGTAARPQWPTTNKELLVMTLGVDENTFPSINSCQGKQTKDGDRISSLLERVLDCVPGISLPEDAHMRYADNLMFG